MVNVSELHIFRTEARTVLAADRIQDMDQAQLMDLQKKFELGCEWGVIEIPVSWAPPGAHRNLSARQVDVEKVTRQVHPEPGQLQLARLVVTRYALLLFITTVPTSRGPVLLAPTSLIQAVRRVCWLLRAALPKAPFTPTGILDRLTSEDLIAKGPASRKRDEVLLKCLDRLRRLGLWRDVPHDHDPYDLEISRAQRRENPQAYEVSADEAQYMPLPDRFVGELGWRMTWIIESLGPALVQCGASLIEVLKNLERHSCPVQKNLSWASLCSKAAAGHIANWDWRDQNGTPIGSLPFELVIKGHGAREAMRWPPSEGRQLIVLLEFLQTVHLSAFLLSTGARISEALSLGDKCLVRTAGSHAIAVGRTYKLQFSNNGELRDWPLPEIAALAIEQQHELARVLAGLGRVRDRNRVDRKVELGTIWSPSIGRSTSVKLMTMVATLQLTALLEGTNLHTHRFRKTIARLAALCIVGSPKILMDLFGHRDIEMTLSYILSYPGIRAEMMEVARAQIIMLAEGSLRTAEANGGPAAPLIRDAIAQERARFGEDFGENNLHALAETLTFGGRHWQLVRPGVICTKLPQQAGPCTRRTGVPDPARCRPMCLHRLEQAAMKDDAERCVEEAVRHLSIAQRAGDEISAEMWKGQILANLRRFDDVAEKWARHPAVRDLQVGER